MVYSTAAFEKEVKLLRVAEKLLEELITEDEKLLTVDRQQRKDDWLDGVTRAAANADEWYNEKYGTDGK